MPSKQNRYPLAEDLPELEMGTNPFSFFLFLATVFSGFATISWVGDVVFMQSLSVKEWLTQMLITLLPGIAATLCLASGTWSAHQMQYKQTMSTRGLWLVITFTMTALSCMCWYLIVSAGTVR